MEDGSLGAKSLWDASEGGVGGGVHGTVNVIFAVSTKLGKRHLLVAVSILKTCTLGFRFRELLRGSSVCASVCMSGVSGSGEGGSGSFSGLGVGSWFKGSTLWSDGGLPGTEGGLLLLTVVGGGIGVLCLRRAWTISAVRLTLEIEIRRRSRSRACLSGTPQCSRIEWL